MVTEKVILVLNCGSSSVKYALFGADPLMRPGWSGALERIGVSGGRFYGKDESGAVLFDTRQDIPDHAQALDRLLTGVQQDALVAVGHRVVHGGPECDCPTFIDATLEERLRKLIPLAPLHLPHNLAGTAVIRKRRPALGRSPVSSCVAGGRAHDRSTARWKRRGFAGMASTACLTNTS